MGTAKKAGGRVYVISADDSNGSTTAEPLPGADLQDALNLLGSSNIDTLRSRYGTYLIAGEPRAWLGSAAPPGQLVEMTITHEGAQGEHIYDADVSNVFYFNGGVSVEMLYANGYNAIDTLNCRNTSNLGEPDEDHCNEVGGVWIEYPSASHGPKGMCKAPNVACIGALPDGVPSVCQQFDDQLAPLFDFLKANKEALPYQPQLDPSTPDSTNMYTCDGFLNTPDYLLASTCASLNRGQCPMPTADELSDVESFKTWVDTKCGNVQFEMQNESTWFTQPVYNPWVKYIRHTLGSSGYSFSQDEGPYGGNAQCHSSGPPLNWEAPTGMRITACPGSDAASPAAAPLPQASRSIVV